MFGALIGFAAPFLPELIGLGRTWMDNRQEWKMMELRLQHAEKEHGWRMDEIEIEGAYKDRASARKQRESYGVQILNAAHDAEGIVYRWTFNVIFLMFSILDWMISTVRPVVTYGVVGIWGAIKVAVIIGAYRETGDIVTALLAPAVWTGQDWDILGVIIGFWFGDSVKRRHAAGARSM